MNGRRKLVLIDANGLVYRAFFALPYFTTSKGRPTNAVYGFTNMLLKILDEEQPGHVAAAFEVAERDEAPVALHPRDRSLWRETHPDEDADIEMEDGGVFDFSSLPFAGSLGANPPSRPIVSVAAVP